MHVLGQVVGNFQLLGGFEDFVVAQCLQFVDLAIHRAHVTYGLDDIAGAGLALGADHRGAFGDAAQRLAQVLRAAHERHFELGLVDVVHVIGGGEDLGLVNVIDVDGLQNARLGDMPDAHFRHHRDGDGLLDAFDHGRVAHAGDAACRADVRGDTLERHDRACAGILGDFRLFRGGDVHDDATFEHLGEVPVEFRAIFFGHVNPFRFGRAGLPRVSRG